MNSSLFAVRKLTQSGPLIVDYETGSQSRNLAGAGVARAGAVHEVNCEELRLSSEEIARHLDARQLRSTDLVMIEGTWTTIADSYQFEEVAEPHARRERRARNTKSALILFTMIAIHLAVMALHVFVRADGTGHGLLLGE